MHNSAFTLKLNYKIIGNIDNYFTPSMLTEVEKKGTDADLWLKFIKTFGYDNDKYIETSEREIILELLIKYTKDKYPELLSSIQNHYYYAKKLARIQKLLRFRIKQARQPVAER